MFSQASLTKGEGIWLGVIFWAIIYTACEAPLNLTFNFELTPWQVAVDIVLSLIFIGDFWYNLRQKRKTKKLIFLQDQGRDKALLLIDILACIPFDLIFYISGLGAGHKLLKLFRLIRLLRILKIFELIGNMLMAPRILRIQIVSISCLVIVHWIACAWIGLNPLPEDMSAKSYYIQSIYWAITTLTTIGYGDITPTTDSGRLFTMLIMLVGVGVYGVVIGNISRIFAEKARFREQTREKIQELSLFMKHYHIPERLQGAVFSYYDHLFTKHLSDNDTKIIADLPQALRSELQIYMNIKLIRNLPVFKNCSQQCLKALAAALLQKSFAPGETIIRIGEVGHEMYIIGHGAVDVILKNGETIVSLHEGQFFGETALLKETSRNANVRANTYCDLYKLDKEDFLKIIETHPELLENMKAVTQKRHSDR